MSTKNDNSRPNPAEVQVICLGLGRTGTSSLREALTTLGFGPSYHMSVIMDEEGKDFPTWYKVGDGNGVPTDFDAVFRNSRSVLDYPACLYPAELYAAYPNAKFILTTRHPAAWEKSMRATILRVNDMLRVRGDNAAVRLTRWNDEYLEPYHHHQLRSNPQQELLIHNQHIKNIIPADKLLVYEVGEGWGKLVEFLGVAEPKEPFPHVHDAAKFQQWLMAAGNKS